MRVLLGLSPLSLLLLVGRKLGEAGEIEAIVLASSSFKVGPAKDVHKTGGDCAGRTAGSQSVVEHLADDGSKFVVWRLLTGVFVAVKGSEGL